MEYLNDITEARTEITTFLMTNGSGLDAELSAQLVTLSSSPSPVDQICHTAELLYARQADVGSAGRRLAAQLAAFAEVNGWHNLREGRGRAVSYAMQRRNGYSAPEGITFQAAADDPEPLEQYVKQPDPAP